MLYLKCLFYFSVSFPSVVWELTDILYFNFPWKEMLRLLPKWIIDDLRKIAHH